MKKLFLLIFIAVIFLCFFAWQKNTSDKKQQTEIQFSSWGSQSEIEVLTPLIKEFEQKNPEIKIKFLHIPQNYFQKLHVLFASKLAPDVIFLNNYYAPLYVKAGLLEDLTPYINQNEFFEKSLSGFTFDSKIYAIPRDISDIVVYYNKDFFKKYNVSYPQKNWSIEDYIETAKKLSKDLNNDGKNDVWGTSFETDTIFWLPYLLSSKASILNDSGEKITICEPAAINALNMYSDIANKYHAAPTKPQSASLTMAQLFLQERIAMHVSGRWLVPKYRKEAKFDWDIVTFPNGKAGSIVNIDASGYAVSKQSKHKQEAVKFVKFISSKESLSVLTKSGLIVPARKDVAYSSLFLSKEKPKNAAAFLEAIENGKPTVVNEDYPRLSDKLNLILEPVFLGKGKAEDALTSAKKFLIDISDNHSCF